MIRTENYLTESEKNQLETIASTLGVKQSALIRQAVDDLNDKCAYSQRLVVVRKVRGLWKNRKDIPALRDLRKGWSRRAAN